MVSLRRLSVLAAAIAAAGLFTAQAARAVTATAQPHPMRFDLGFADGIKNIGHRRGWYGYSRGYYRPWRRGYYYGYPYRRYYAYPRYAYSYGYDYPYHGYGYPYYGYPYAYGGPVVSFGFGFPFWGGPSGFDDDGLK